MCSIRFALRILRKSPGFTAVAILTLAVGIGANTGMFSLINAVLRQPLPGIANPRRLASLFRMQKNNPFSVMGYPDYVHYRDRCRSFSGLAAHSATWMNLDSGTPERIIGDVVTGNYFSVLGVRPALGRLIVPSALPGVTCHEASQSKATRYKVRLCPTATQISA